MELPQRASQAAGCSPVTSPASTGPCPDSKTNPNNYPSPPPPTLLTTNRHNRQSPRTSTHTSWTDYRIPANSRQHRPPTSAQRRRLRLSSCVTVGQEMAQEQSPPWHPNAAPRIRENFLKRLPLGNLRHCPGDAIKYPISVKYLQSSPTLWFHLSRNIAPFMNLSTYQHPNIVVVDAPSRFHRTMLRRARGDQSKVAPDQRQLDE